MGTGNVRQDIKNELPMKQEFVKMLENKGFENINVMDGYFPYYDIEAQKEGKIIRYELKEDFGKNKDGEYTGNVAVEHKYKGGGNVFRPSGTEVSTANFWVYLIHEPNGSVNWHIMKLDDLKKIIDEHLWHRDVITYKDPSTPAMCYLFYLKDIKNISLRIIPSRGINNG